MKRKIQLTKGLSINKEAIAKLQESQMAQLKGGMQNKLKHVLLVRVLTHAVVVPVILRRLKKFLKKQSKYQLL